ncbi:MAG: hypothetical protein Ta2G_03710 [Termitinemataceae bacterium]|nr:MAG: hypothetical protein Ta2G_03710 [Termitinemataceae bacterium]
MPDIFVPGVKSRFDTEKIISGLMEVERIPRNRVAGDNEKLEVQKTHWQELGRRITQLRESSRSLFSHQNPFKDSKAVSSDPFVLDATSTREAGEQSHDFIVKQIAKADKLLSNDLDKSFTIAAGNYVFSTGKNDVSFNYKGGTVNDFASFINRRGNGKIKADTVGIRAGTTALVIESLDTGSENKLSFSGAALDMALKTGILGNGKTEPKTISIKAIDANNANAKSGKGPDTLQTDVQGDVLMVSSMSKSDVSMNGGITVTPTMILKIETSVRNSQGLQTGSNSASGTTITSQHGKTLLTPALQGGATDEGVFDPSKMIAVEDQIDGDVDGKYSVQKQRLQGAAQGEGRKSGDGFEYGPLSEDSENNASASSNIQDEARVDNLDVLSLIFSDGSSIDLPAIKDNSDFSAAQYNLSEFAKDKMVSYLRVNNNNTHREVSLRNIHILDPLSNTSGEPLHPITTAQDAIIDMDGIEVMRPTNEIDDLIPGIILKPKNESDKTVKISVEHDTESIKYSVVEFVRNYNLLMADLNVLTRSDEAIIKELTYLSKEETDEMKEKLGVFTGDNTLTRFRGSLQQIVTAPYRVDDGNQYMFADFGISTDARRSGSYDPSKLRGYLEVDEKVFDDAIATKLKAMSQVFGRDTDGDLIIDSGAAYDMERAVRPFVELGGIISTKTGTIDRRVDDNKKRIETMDKQLASKEQKLKNQYGQMEGAYNRMEKLGNSLETFSNQNSKN